MKYLKFSIYTVLGLGFLLLVIIGVANASGTNQVKVYYIENGIKKDTIFLQENVTKYEIDSTGVYTFFVRNPTTGKHKIITAKNYSLDRFSLPFQK